MKLEVGKFYRVRNPKTVDIIKVRIDGICEDRSHTHTQVNLTFFYENGKRVAGNCRLDGKWCDAVESNLDLVEEYHEPPKSVWDLKDDDEYYSITSYGAVKINFWGQIGTETVAREIGGCFLTRGEAEQELKRRILEIKITKRIAELNEGWVPDWSGRCDTKNWVIYLFKGRLSIESNLATKIAQNRFYLKSDVLAKQLSKELEPELIEYLNY